MADDQALTPQLPDDQPSWLAKNRKLVILGGAVLVLIIAAAFTAISGHVTTTVPTNTIANVNQGNTNSASTRPTFQRSTIANVSTELPPSYRPPTTTDLKNAITNLSTNSSR